MIRSFGGLGSSAFWDGACQGTQRMWLVRQLGVRGGAGWGAERTWRKPPAAPQWMEASPPELTPSLAAVREKNDVKEPCFPKKPLCQHTTAAHQ